MLVLATIYAKGYEGPTGVAEGACFDVRVGIFAAFAFVGVNYATLNIGLSQELASLRARPEAITLIETARQRHEEFRRKFSDAGS